MFLYDRKLELGEKELSEFISSFVTEKQPRLMKLKRYYLADNPEIVDKPVVDITKPNHRISHSFAATVTDTHVGYFMGSPITFSSDNESAVEALRLIGARNDDQSQNLRIAQDCSIYGVAYELHYVDMKRNIKYRDVDPRHSFVIYSNDLEKDPLYLVRFFPLGGDKDEWQVEVYGPSKVDYYKVTGGIMSGTVEWQRNHTHGFSQTPVAVFFNNRFRTGDFEKVIPMIDAYDAITSNTLDDLENLADAYLVFRDVSLPGETVEEQARYLKEMRENRIIQYNGEGEVSWLTKDVADGGAWSGPQAKIEELIYTHTATPRFTDENFVGNASGVALKYKLLPLEQKAASKEREFRKGLERRISLINDMAQILGIEEYLDIEFQFKRTLPIDILSEMEGISKGYGLVSHETLLSQVSFVNDPSDELEKLQEEQGASLDFDFLEETNEEEENE